MKVLICGGHVTPALEVITALPKKTTILYVGRKHPLEGDTAVSLEYQVIKQIGIPFVEFDPGKLQRTFTPHMLSSLVKLPKGFFHAAHIIDSFSPDIIIGFGSYVSLPLCFIGWTKRIPFITHEQTLGAGLANRILAPFATETCISWESSKRFLHTKHIYLTGNPAVSGYFSVRKNKIPKKHFPHIVIVGGSQGSHVINTLVENTLLKLLSFTTVTHQTGDAKAFRDYERLQAYKKQLPKKLQDRYEIATFFTPEQTARQLAQADLVVTRGGMNTILELLILNTPALVIPLTVSSQQEQRKNAFLIKEAGLGEIAYQDTLTPASFFSLLSEMVHNRESYVLSTPYKEQLEIHKNAAKKLVERIIHQTAYRHTEKT